MKVETKLKVQNSRLVFFCKLLIFIMYICIYTCIYMYEYMYIYVCMYVFMYENSKIKIVTIASEVQTYLDNAKTRD